ncbi:flagellar hook assembly protein FlgD [Zavarzinella formosa]|uniref:flagellar hook assembly protein FlgD n=1 Tax=Zavarzinella formosa TaxID=360055 RepID=UPI000316948D|nr:flagellar hook capping FlgD N-terminal domain-containing protein [Zavarzinella formosa]
MAAAASSTTASGLQDQFLQLLVAQLQNQDPLNPVSDADFIGQLAQFNQLSSLQSLNANFSEMLKFQQLGQGSSLIGKTVAYTDASGAAKTGVVNRVLSDGTNISIQIGTDKVGLGSITGVS